MKITRCEQKNHGGMIHAHTTRREPDASASEHQPANQLLFADGLNATLEPPHFGTNTEP
jgi:hypothetical protein